MAFQELDGREVLDARDAKEVRWFLEADAACRQRLAERDAAAAAFVDARERREAASRRLLCLTVSAREVYVLVDNRMVVIRRVGEFNDERAYAVVEEIRYVAAPEARA